MQNESLTNSSASQPTGSGALFVSAPIKISSDMTPPELAVALRKLAAKAATTDGMKLLALANSFDRPALPFKSTDRAGRRVVEFRVGGKAYRTRPEWERRAALGLAGL